MARALDIKAVEEKTSFKESRLRDLIERNGFPRPVKLGGRKNLWLEDEVDAWILAQFEKRKAGGVTARRTNGIPRIAGESLAAFKARCAEMRAIQNGRG